MTPFLAGSVVLAGVTVGFLSALLGVGGGIVMVPFMILVLGKGQHLAEGTSLLVIIPTAIVGVLVHRRRGYISWASSLVLAIGGIAGALVGARLALLMEPSRLKAIFGAFLIMFGMRVAVSALRMSRVERLA